MCGHLEINNTVQLREPLFIRLSAKFFISRNIFMSRIEFLLFLNCERGKNHPFYVLVMPFMPQQTPLSRDGGFPPVRRAHRA